ncbi:MAG: hypothetical protein WDZ85_00055 [Candidatus Paceibacterota bacterium]
MKYCYLLLVLVLSAAVLGGCPFGGGKLVFDVSVDRDAYQAGDPVIVTAIFSGSRAPYDFAVDFDDGVSVIGWIDDDGAVQSSVVSEYAVPVSVATDFFGHLEISRPAWTTNQTDGVSVIDWELFGIDGQGETETLAIRVPIATELKLDLKANNGGPPSAVGDALIINTKVSGGRAPYELEITFPPSLHLQTEVSVKVRTTVDNDGTLRAPGWSNHTVVPVVVGPSRGIRVSSPEPNQVVVHYRWTELMPGLAPVQVALSDRDGRMVTGEVWAGSTTETPTLVPVPELVGLTKGKAVTATLAAGLYPTILVSANDDFAPELVFNQRTEAGELVRLGHRLVIDLSR